MTNDKFKPFVPKTYEQFVLEEQQIQSTKQDQTIADSYAAEVNSYGNVGVQEGYGPCRSRGSYVAPNVVAIAGLSYGCHCSKEQLLEQLRQAENERDYLWEKLNEYKAKWEEYKAEVENRDRRQKNREEWQRMVSVAGNALPGFGGLFVDEIMNIWNRWEEFAYNNFLRNTTYYYNRTAEKYNEIRNWYNGIKGIGYSFFS